MPPKPVSEKEQLEAEIVGCEGRINNLGIQMHERFYNDCWKATIVDQLVELGVDQDELEMKYVRKVHERIHEVHDEIMEKQEQQKTIAVPDKRIVGPDGNPISL